MHPYFAAIPTLLFFFILPDRSCSTPHSPFFCICLVQYFQYLSIVLVLSILVFQLLIVFSILSIFVVQLDCLVTCSSQQFLVVGQLIESRGLKAQLVECESTSQSTSKACHLLAVQGKVLGLARANFGLFGLVKQVAKIRTLQHYNCELLYVAVPNLKARAMLELLNLQSDALESS